MPGMRRIAFLFGAALLAVTAACGGSDSKTTTTTSGAPPTVASTGQNFGAAATVALKNLKFEPADVTIKTGQQVEWIWQDALPHNITSETFKSETKTSGKFVYTFATAGDFAYQCTLHPGMTGTVKVT
jgi:plastocyanin